MGSDDGGISEHSSELHLIDRNLEKHVSRSLHTKKFTGDPDHIAVSGVSCWRTGDGAGQIRTYEALQWRGEIYVGGSLLLDLLENSPFPTGNDGMKFVVDFTEFGMQSALLHYISDNFMIVEMDKLTSSSNITRSRTRERSTESPGPVTTNSQTLSVSRPDHPALLLIPSGGVRFESARGLLTTAM